MPPQTGLPKWFFGTGWGSFEKTDNASSLTVVSGELKLKSINLPYVEKVASVVIDGNEIDFEFKNGMIDFSEIVIKKHIVIS